MMTILLIISIIIIILLLLIRLLFGAVINIHITDGAIMCLLTYLISRKLLAIHPVICIFILVGIILIIVKLNGTKVGYMVLSAIFTLFYAIIGGLIGYLINDRDILWAIAIFILVFCISGLLHLYVKDKNKQ